MKRRNREISIFSMSALDLFASALGAFILLAIVIFPYFPNTGLAPVVVIAGPEPEPCDPLPPCPDPDPDPPRCPSCCPTCPEPGTQFPHLDLVIALDVTGSMSAQIASLKAEIDQLSLALNALTPSFGMGIVAFGDRYWERPVTIFDLQEISTSSANATALRDFVDQMASNMGQGAGGNPDPAEAFLLALEVAADMSWRPRADMRMIVLITDNPAYVDEVDAAVEEAASFAAAGGGRRVSTVFIDTGGEPRTEPFLERVAEVGAGQFVRDTGGSITVTLLLSLL